MSKKKHIRFDFKQTGLFVFFFLNFFLSAAPFINASGENNNYSKQSGFLSQNYNLEDPEDNSHSNFSTEPQEYRIAARGKQKLAQLSNTKVPYSFLPGNDIPDRVSDHPFASSSFMARCEYYTFLSRYKLF